MKRYITVEQLRGVKIETLSKYFKYKEKQTFLYEHEICRDYFTIGRMIEYLGDWLESIYIMGNAYRVAIEIPQGTHTLDKGHAWSCYELCDSLWKAVKEKIELEYNVSD